MMSGFNLIRKFPALATLLLLELLLLLLVSFQLQINRRVSLLEKTSLMMIGPVQELNHNMVETAAGALKNKKTRAELAVENKRLRLALEKVGQLRTALEESERENSRLRQMMGLPGDEGWRYVAAEVIGRTHRRNDYMVTINRGASSGIRRDQGVLGPDGVVGVIWEVSGGYAKVMTVNNPSSVVAALVQDTRYLESYVVGTGPRSGSLENFPNFENLKNNDLILTSGLDGLFPKGLYIGRVRSARPSAYLFRRVELQFSTDFSKLEEVVVLIPDCEEAFDEME
jgi:rod shape-determining protein MreC